VPLVPLVPQEPLVPDGPSAWETRARGQHYSVGVIFLFVTLVVDASISMRGGARVLAVVRELCGLALEVPDWTTGRSWLLRVGYYKLMRPKEKADDWVLFIDHSCQIGNDKCLVILGIRLRDLPPPGECLRLEHLEPLEVLPVKSSTQADVATQLTAVATKIGAPRAIVRDEGGDLRGGVELFRAQYPQTADIYDIKHKTACLLRHVLEADERWSEFTRRVGATKCQVQQTELAFLAPPSQRLKARYMNLAELVRWGKETTALLDKQPAEVLQHVTVERLETKLGWLREYQVALAEWSELMTVTNIVEDFVRRQGLYAGAGWDLAQRRPDLSHACARQLWKDLVKHVAQQAAQARLGERLPGSTEVLESCFGKLKQLEKEQNRSCFTGLLLALGVVVSRTTPQVVQAALEACPLKNVWRWCRQKLGYTVQAQRRMAYGAGPAQ
jgi:hypothetical protein